jgi:hypothetical protein
MRVDAWQGRWACVIALLAIPGGTLAARQTSSSQPDHLRHRFDDPARLAKSFDDPARDA